MVDLIWTDIEVGLEIDGASLFELFFDLGKDDLCDSGQVSIRLLTTNPVSWIETFFKALSLFLILGIRVLRSPQLF